MQAKGSISGALDKAESSGHGALRFEQKANKGIESQDFCFKGL